MGPRLRGDDGCDAMLAPMRIRGDDGPALNSACQSLFADFFTRSFAGMTPNRRQLSIMLARMGQRGRVRPSAGLEPGPAERVTLEILSNIGLRARGSQEAPRN